MRHEKLPMSTMGDTALMEDDDTSATAAGATSEVIGFPGGRAGEEAFTQFLERKCARKTASSDVPSEASSDASSDPSGGGGAGRIDFLQLDISTAAIQPIPAVCDALLQGEEAQWYRDLSLVSVVEIFGVTSDGRSILAHVHGFFPYVYIPFSEGDGVSLADLRATLNAKLENEGGLAVRGSNKFTGAVPRVALVQRHSLMHYRGPEPQSFAQVWLSSPRLVAAIRRIVTSTRVEVVSKSTGARRTLEPAIFEANIGHELRFMVDLDMPGCCWLSLHAGRFRCRRPTDAVSHCQLEVDVGWRDVLVHQPDQMHAIPPLRVLSLDIECITASGRGFPSATKDPIIQVAVAVAEGGALDASAVEGGELFNVVFTLKECGSLSGLGSTVVWFDSEADLLRRLSQLIIATDPDIITGFNVINFDLNYILDRAAFHKITQNFFLSRLKNTPSTAKNTVLSSRALGTHENKDINIEGRIQMDMLEVVRREHKLKSYTLNAVAAHFLKQQKEDVHYTQLFDLHHGNPQTRARIARYCLKDAQLPLRLFARLLVAVNYIEMARVTGVPLSFLLTRGQQIKVTSQILRQCRKAGFLFPTAAVRGGDDETKYEGATVLEPLKGLYREPIATLDFASLYPSIMIAHNLCYSTLLAPGESVPAGLTHDKDVNRTPVQCQFVRPHVRPGILPTVVSGLLDARRRARAEMKKTEDANLRVILNGRQLALKLSANSVYGYTGATAGGQLPCLEVSTSITAYGRDMIDFTKDAVEAHFRRENGYERDATVVYGDTDSVMVKFGVSDLRRAMDLGAEAAALVSGKFLPPIKLEFEKVFCPFLLMNKKRYAGLMFTGPEEKGRVDCKGIETVRRDFCLLVQQIVDTVLKRILLENDPDGAIEYTKQVIADLLQNKVDMSLLVISKSLGKEDYANKRMAHVELARKLAIRDPHNAPQTGDRVHYVICAGSKGQAQYERAEDPLFALENNLGIDTAYYLETVKNPLARVFEGLKVNIESLFSGAHTDKRRVLTSATSGLGKFMKSSLRCLGCRSVLKETANGPPAALCEYCAQSREREIILAKVAELRSKETEYVDLWTECQRCQGSVTQDILCTSRDCPIFYRRMKVIKDIGEAEKQVQRFHCEW